MQIFWHDLKSYRRSTVVWSVSLGLMAVLFLALFPSFTQDVEASQALLKNLPAPVREALGISLAHFFTVLGFFSYLFTFVSVAGAVQAMNVGVGIIAKESTGKTADFLLSKPVSRNTVISQKLFAATLVLVLTSIVFTLAALTAAYLFSKDSFDVVALVMIALSLLPLQLIFMALGMCVAVLLGRIKSVIAVTLPTVFAFFIVGSVGSVVDNEVSRYLTPFKYFDPQYIVQHGFYEMKFMGLAILIIAAALTLTYLMFNKKDINSGV